MSEETYIDKIKGTSIIAGLFNPEMKGENLMEAISARIGLASPLLHGAINTARQGEDDGTHFCRYCEDVVELLEGYKAIIRLTLDAAQKEQMRREKGEAA